MKFTELLAEKHLEGLLLNKTVTLFYVDAKWEMSSFLVLGIW
jgi:hypothetical protein